MSEIALKDILINARQESYRMRHFFLGVEHLFIALLEIKGGLTASILEDEGLKPEYVISAIRRKMGKGSVNRLWAGMPNTPRADVVLSIANDLALENGRAESNERDLLTAILEEGDSATTRVLKRLGLDIDRLAREARTRTFKPDGQQPYVRIDFSPNFDSTDALNDEALFILRRMFHGYSVIRVERHLTGGYSKALILVVTPIQADNREDAVVVVKIDHADHVLDEAQRYETHVRGTLPPLTARLEEKPTAPDTSDLAGLKYTFVSENGRIPADLREVIGRWNANELGMWLLDDLYPYFGKTWWRQRRAFRFQVVNEYDWLLPPILTLEMSDEPAPDSSRTIVIREPVKRAKLKELEYGDRVIVENFTVQRVYHDRDAIQLSIGRGTEAAKRAYKIEVKGVGLAHNTYYRGEIIERLSGTVWRTRNEVLNHAARALKPDFDLRQETIPGANPTEKLPNPLIAYDELLDRYVNGSLSTIHGDLHLGNILVGPNRSPFLIDFGQTRDGHTLFDWASLECSLLSEVVLPVAGESWDSARLVLHYVAALNMQAVMPEVGLESVRHAMSCVIATREIVQDCLAARDAWSEYYTALAMCALRAINWETMWLGGRRLLFLVSALAMHELQRKPRSSNMPDTLSQDDTDHQESELP